MVRQLLTESCVLAGVAGLAGLLLASTLVQALAALSPANLPRIDEVRMDMPVLLFALGLSLVSTVLFGLVPALHGSRLDLSGALKQGGSKATGTRASARLRSALVVAEVALSVILLVTAGLLLRSFQTLQHVDLGFTKDRVLVADTVYAVRDGVTEDLRTRSRFYADVLDRLRAVPGVSAASGVAFLGMGREPRSPRDFYIQGRPEGRPGERPQAEYHAITADYFKTLEIPVRAGRDFDRTDTPERPRVAIINETLARTAFPGSRPLDSAFGRGRIAGRPGWRSSGLLATPVGRTRANQRSPVIYAASTQGAGNSLAILARTSLDEQSLASTLRAIMHDANPTVPVKFETMEELFDATLAYPRFRTQVIGLFAGLWRRFLPPWESSACWRTWWDNEHGSSRSAGPSAPGPPMSSASSLVKGCGWSRSASCWDLPVRSPWRGCSTGLLYEIGPWDVGTYLGAIVVLGSAACSPP